MKTRAPIIDFHTHFFPEKLLEALWRWFANNDWPIPHPPEVGMLVAKLRQAGVWRCVSLHYPHKVGLSNTLNQWAYELGKKYSDFLIPFGSVHPDEKDPQGILRRCFEDYGFPGIKLHSHVQRVAPDDPRLAPIYDVCASYQRIVLIHCGTGPHFRDHPGYGYDVSEVTGIHRFQKIVSKYPSIPFVVPHLGYEEIPEFFKLLDHVPNLYLDTSMALAGYFPVDLKKEWLSQYADRLLFGTDFPLIPHDWDHEIKILKGMKLGKEVFEKITWKNAARLLKLK